MVHGKKKTSLRQDGISLCDQTNVVVVVSPRRLLPMPLLDVNNECPLPEGIGCNQSVGI